MIFLSEIEKVNIMIIYQNEITNFDAIIAEKSALKNANIIKDNFTNLTSNQKFSVTKMWSLKKRLNMETNEPPMAKFDKNGQLITSKKGLLTLYEEEYKQRLCPPNPHEGYEELQSMKEYLFKLRMELAKNETSPQWNAEQIFKIC